MPTSSQASSASSVKATFPNRDIILALTADEEGGKSNGVSWLLKNRPELMHAEFVINPDGEGPTLHDGKATELLVEATQKTYADYRITATNPRRPQLRAAPRQCHLRAHARTAQARIHTLSLRAQ